ncbi:hypothetical protein [Acinetobacter bereziniae]|uniref:hypothetical protein n=1 Tax=Acinetobacter bereziniae TaxID=106648 RepID=UPI0012501846|nr:hypothetical protein [Acinetobacter bereziniae]
MHSNKMVFAFVLATMMTSAWAESAPTPATTLAEEKTVSQGKATTPSETQTEVRVEDIDAPILE